MDATANELTFPFVEELPRREKSRWQKLRDTFEAAKKISEEKGMLVPASLAAKLGDVSKQRIGQLIEQGVLERVELDGHVFIPEQSLVLWLKAPTDKGGRPRKNPSLLQMAKMANDFAHGR